eukprot:6594442-Prymnesium_polylepis.3
MRPRPSTALHTHLRTCTRPTARPSTALHTHLTHTTTQLQLSTTYNKTASAPAHVPQPVRAQHNARMAARRHLEMMDLRRVWGGVTWGSHACGSARRHLELMDLSWTQRPHTPCPTPSLVSTRPSQTPSEAPI